MVEAFAAALYEHVGSVVRYQLLVPRCRPSMFGRRASGLVWFCPMVWTPYELHTITSGSVGFK